MYGNRLRVVHDNNSSKGVGFVGLLQLAFIILKVCNVINWSWWIVFLPTFASVGLTVIVFAIAWFLLKE